MQNFIMITLICSALIYMSYGAFLSSFVVSRMLDNEDTYYKALLQNYNVITLKQKIIFALFMQFIMPGLFVLMYIKRHYLKFFI